MKKISFRIEKRKDGQAAHLIVFCAHARGTRKTADEERGEQHWGRQEAAGAQAHHGERPAHPQRALGESQASARHDSESPREEKKGRKGKEEVLKRIGSGIATLMGNDIDDDRGTDDRGDGIERDNALVAW